jgi:CheY-like chemotaxis protein
MEMTPAVAMEQIPSLILQPIVENALKHSLGPKPGPGHLWITAEADGNQVRLRVEDDGVGPAIGVLKFNGSNGRSNGVGLEAIEKIEELRPDLLFLDIEMPGLKGFEVLRSIPSAIEIPLVIFTTGYDQHAFAAFEANALAYLLKPRRPQQ